SRISNARPRPTSCIRRELALPQRASTPDAVQPTPLGSHSHRLDGSRHLNDGGKNYDESTHRPNGGRALPPADDPARQRAPALWDRVSIANRARRVSLSRQRRQSQPAPRRHHHPPRHVQEAPLASERADLLSAPPAL